MGERTGIRYTSHLSDPNWDVRCGVGYYTPLPDEAAGKRWELEVEFAAEQTLDTPVECERKGVTWHFSADPPIGDFVIFGLHVRWFDEEGDLVHTAFLSPWEDEFYRPGPIRLKKSVPKARSVEAKLVGGRFANPPQQLVKLANE